MYLCIYVEKFVIKIYSTSLQHSRYLRFGTILLLILGIKETFPLGDLDRLDSVFGHGDEISDCVIVVFMSRPILLKCMEFES